MGSVARRLRPGGPREASLGPRGLSVRRTIAGCADRRTWRRELWPPTGRPIAYEWCLRSDPALSRAPSSVAFGHGLRGWDRTDFDHSSLGSRWNASRDIGDPDGAADRVCRWRWPCQGFRLPGVAFEPTLRDSTHPVDVAEKGKRGHSGIVNDLTRPHRARPARRSELPATARAISIDELWWSRRP